jgi:hypothetical protein
MKCPVTQQNSRDTSLVMPRSSKHATTNRRIDPRSSRAISQSPRHQSGHPIIQTVIMFPLLSLASTVPNVTLRAAFLAPSPTRPKNPNFPDASTMMIRPPSSKPSSCYVVPGGQACFSDLIDVFKHPYPYNRQPLTPHCQFRHQYHCPSKGTNRVSSRYHKGAE